MQEDMKNSNIKQKMKYRLLFSIIILALVFCSRKGDIQKGIDAIKKGEYLKAVKSLNTVLKTDSLNSEAHFNLSLAYAHLDSTDKSFYHYLKICELESNLRKDVQLKEMLANFLNLEPYASTLVSMKRMNQFKGTFSPDGKKIVVAAARRDIANIYLVNLDGSIIKKLTKQGMNTDPDFSPTGEHVVFVSDIDGDEELYLYDLVTNQMENLTDNTADDFSPSFSPDGKEIVFVSNMDNIYQWEIYKINVTNKKIKRLTKNQYWDGFPKFSSDGKRIVFSSKRKGSEDIYIMKENGGGEKLLYTSPADENDPMLLNENLFFKSNRNGKWEIYRFNLKNKSLIRLTFNAYPDWNPRISKDGTKIVVSRKKKKRWLLYFINLNNPISAELIIAKIKKSK